jgi:hypothetical protein
MPLRIVSVFVIALLSVLPRLAPAQGDAAPPPAEELLRHAMRFPVAGVPRVDRAPQVDGRVEEAEWAAAALLPDLMTSEARQHEGAAPRYRTRVWLQYDATALYVACRAEYPDWAAEPPPPPPRRDYSSGHESHVDLFLNPTAAREHGEMWHFAGNASGSLLDRHLADAAKGMAWNPEVDYRARNTAAGWEGEFRLPFAALGVPPPKPGDHWRANFFFIRMKPARTLSTWSPWVEWRQRQGGLGYGWLRFGADATAVRFESGVGEADRAAPVIRVVGPGLAQVEGVVELLRRTDTFAPEHPSMVMNVARWHSERNVGGAAFIGANVDQLTAEALKRFAPMAQRGVPATGAVELPPTPELGEYLLRYRFVRTGAGAEEVLAAGAVSYRVKPQIAISLRPMLLGADLVETTVDFADLRDLARAASLRVEARAEGAAAPAFEQTRPVVGAEPVTLTLPGKAVPPGRHAVRATVLDAAGKALAEAAAPLDRPAPPEWWLRPVGAQPEVPKPWTPVRVAATDAGGRLVSVWGREYRFSGLPVPDSVRTTPARYSTAEPPQPAVELLAAPMSFRLRVGGRDAALAARPLRAIESTAERTVFESLLSGAGVELRGRTTVEFDGFIRVDLEIAPAAGAARVEGLDFVVPFNAGHAQLLGNFKKAPGPGREVDRYLGLLPRLPWTAPVFYAQTVGTDRVGLQWVCDSARDWRLEKPDLAVELRRAGDRVEEVFRFIDHPVELTAPLRISFGLMALPCKPLPERWGTLRIISSAPPPAPPLDDPAAVAAWKDRLRYTRPDISIDHNPGWSGTPWYPYPFQDKAAEAAMRRRLDLYHQAGLRYCPHSGWQAISTLIPEWATFGKEMAIEPETETIGKTVFACYNSPYSAFTAWNWEHHARTIGIDGIKADTMFPQTPCASLYHDCGWKDEKGRLWPAVNIFATREFFKRLYRIFHGGVKTDGVLTAAQTGAPIAPVCSFADIVVISEGLPYHHARSLKEGYPQDLVRALMVGAPYGLITIHDLKGLPLNAAERSAALLVAGADPRFMSAPGHYLRGYAKCAPGMFVFQLPTRDIWEAWDWIDRGGAALWMPHWENGAALALAPARTGTGAPAEMYASMYVQPGRKVLLIVTNYEKESALAEVRLDLARLGFAPDAAIQAEDAVTRVPETLTGGTLRLGVLGERFRLVKLWVGDAPRYAETRLGPDLLGVGGFETWPDGLGSLRTPPGQAAPCAARDETRAFAGKAALRVEKTTPAWRDGADAAQVALKPLRLEPGDYVLEGALLIEKNFGLPVEGGRELGDAAVAQVLVAGPGIEYDPPAWASVKTGRFIAEEKTAGWDRFLIAFRVPAAGPVTVTLHLGGVGVAWFDGLQLRRVKEQTPGNAR